MGIHERGAVPGKEVTAFPDYESPFEANWGTKSGGTANLTSANISASILIPGTQGRDRRGSGRFRASQTPGRCRSCGCTISRRRPLPLLACTDPRGKWSLERGRTIPHNGLSPGQPSEFLIFLQSEPYCHYDGPWQRPAV